MVYRGFWNVLLKGNGFSHPVGFLPLIVLQVSGIKSIKSVVGFSLLSKNQSSWYCRNFGTVLILKRWIKPFQCHSLSRWETICGTWISIRHIWLFRSGSMKQMKIRRISDCVWDVLTLIRSKSLLTWTGSLCYRTAVTHCFNFMPKKLIHNHMIKASTGLNLNIGKWRMINRQWWTSSSIACSQILPTNGNSSSTTAQSGLPVHQSSSKDCDMPLCVLQLGILKSPPKATRRSCH